MTNTPEQKNQAPVPRSLWSLRISPLVPVAIVAGMALVFCANFHVVYGGNHEPAFLKKDTLTLKESFVSWDEILDTPKFFTMLRHPLVFKALTKEGLLHFPEIAPSTVTHEARVDNVQLLLNKSSALCRELSVDTPSFYGKRVNVVVSAELDDYYNFKYTDKQETHYSIAFTCGDQRGHGYAPRKTFKPLFDHLMSNRKATVALTLFTDRSHGYNDTFSILDWTASLEDGSVGVLSKADPKPSATVRRTKRLTPSE